MFDYVSFSENRAKGLQLRKYLGAVAFNNITRLVFGKRFMNAEGVVDDQGLEFKAIVSNGLKLGASLSIAEHIPWLRWMFPADEKAFAEHGARRDRLTRAIMEEHTLARQKSSGAKQHFVDALLTLKDQYDLSEDTIIGLLWVSFSDFMKSVELICVDFLFPTFCIWCVCAGYDHSRDGHNSDNSRVGDGGNDQESKSATKGAGRVRPSGWT